MTVDLRAPATVQPDRLDETARAFFYAQFVCATYQMGESLGNEPPPPAPPLPDGFEVIADVYMTDFVFAPDTEATHYGLLAAKGSHFVLAIRGTVGWKEWWADLNALRLVPCVFTSSTQQHGQVGFGFLALYSTLHIKRRSAGALAGRDAAAAPQGDESFASAVKTVIADHLTRTDAGAADRDLKVDVAGHSLGSALATLYAMDSHDRPDYYPTRSLITFASPLVGDATFAADFTQKFPSSGPPYASLRYAISSDVVPTVPPTWLGFVHVGVEVQLKLGWSTPWWWPPCSHSLSSYMHVLDPDWPLPGACTGSNDGDRCSAPGKRESAVV